MFACPLFFLLSASVTFQDWVVRPNETSRPPIRVVMSRLVSLNATNMPLEEAVRKLCEQAGAQFVVSGPTGGLVNLHIVRSSLQSALIAVTKSASYTYRITDGIITLVRPESGFGVGMGTGIPYPPPGEPFQQAVYYISASDAVRRLREKPGFRPEDGVSLDANRGINAVIITTQSTEQLREAREALRLMDMMPDEMEVRADIVLYVASSARGLRPLVTSTSAMTENGKPTTFRFNLADCPSGEYPQIVGGRSVLNMTCRSVGGARFALDATWSADVTVRPARGSRLRKVHGYYRGSSTVLFDRTQLLTAMVSPRGDGLDPRLEVRITPRLIRNDREYADRPNMSDTETVVIGSFVDKTSNENTGYATLAQKSVASEMARNRHYGVIMAGDIDTHATNLGLSPPYSATAYTRIAEIVDATAVVSGVVRRVERSAVGADDAVVARVAVTMTDPYSLEILDRAEGAARETARAGTMSQKALEENAIYSAGRNAVRLLVNRHRPPAVVLATWTDAAGRKHAVINRGTHDGYAAGQTMTVFSYRQRIGRLRVSRVGGTSSDAVVIENAREIRPEDEARVTLQVSPKPD